MQKLVILLPWFMSIVYGETVVEQIKDRQEGAVDEIIPSRARALTSFLLATAHIGAGTRGAIPRTTHLMSGSEEPTRQRNRLVSPSMQASAAGQGEMVDGVRIGPPPDLPSLLLKNRIVYIGAPLVPEVTELVVAELLYLSSVSQDDIYMYINSPGSPMTTDAFAITDTMDYIKPDVHTICVGTAFGTAAMVLANGAKGKRTCLPNAKVMLQQPRSQARGQASDIEISAREILNSRKEILELLSKRTGQDLQKLKDDSSRTKYFKATEAQEYGLVDRVMSSEDLAVKPEMLGSR